jgi:DNA-binding response OmpR family regulator
MLCRAILERENFEVETLPCCDNILGDITEIKPDVILMDLWIPNIGGEKAIAIAKKDEDAAKVPILVFSANNDIQTISEKVNANGFLEKPFKIASLLAVIKANIEG